MRILYLCGREPGYIRNLMLRNALRRSYDVVEITSSSRNLVGRNGSVALRYLLANRRAFDLIVVGFYGQPLMPWVRLWAGAPILFDAYVSTYDTLCFDRRWFRPRSLPGRLAFALDRWSCRWADRVLFDTQAHRNYFVHTFGLPPAKTAVAYVGCDETHFAPRPASPPGQTFHVFTYASFLRLHGVEHILHAAKQLVEQDDVLFTIAGAGSHLAAMQRLARELELHNVRFPDWVPFDQLPGRIAEAELCLGGHFSDIPKAGRVIATKTFQFLAMGKPTIVGDNPANREVMSHRQNAYLCPMADPVALASAILELRDDPLLRQRLGKEGLALYRERFTTDATAKALRTVLNGLAV